MIITRTGRIVLYIRGYQLNFRKLEIELGMEATYKGREGEYGDIFTPRLPSDTIVFQYNIEEEDTPNDIVNSFVSYLLSTKFDFSELSKTCEISLNCVIQSDYDQVGFDFTTETMQKIDLLGLGFDISLIPGDAEYDDDEVAE